MGRDVTRFFEDVVLPRIRQHCPKVLPHMSILVEGSVGLGWHDEWSDLELTIYLNDPLWAEHGGQLQLLMMHGLPRFSPHSEPHCSFPGDPHRWDVAGHPEVNVHPVSWLLDHHAQEFLVADQDRPWEMVSIEALYALHNDLVLSDPESTLERLREATTEDCYPAGLWQKLLIHRLHDLKGVPWDFEKAVLRRSVVDAQVRLGQLLQGLMEIGFLIERCYYPWQKHLWRAFQDLKLATRAVPCLETASTAPEWGEKLGAVKALLSYYTEVIIDRGVLTPTMLEYLPEARNGSAWSDPEWLARWRRYARLAQDAGYDPQDGWVWGLWRWA
jgi:hypothetical protein